jgi:hypothetical protein
MLARRQVFEQVGDFDEQWQLAHVLDWFLRAKAKNITMKMLPDVVARRRLHGDNLGVRQRAFQREYAQVLKHHLDVQRRVVTT